MESTIASRVQQEIVHLKREVVRDDTQGHSCEQCQHITLKLNPKPWPTKIEPSLRLDTTIAEVRNFAASGCNFWSMIRNKLALIDLQGTIKGEQYNVAFDLKKHKFPWSDEHYQDLAASIGGVLEKEYLHLRKRSVGWVFTARANDEVDFPVTKTDFVRVIIRCVAVPKFFFEKDSVTMEIALITPTRPVGTELLPHDGKWELQLGKDYTTFWILASPGNLADSARSCIGSPINLNPGSSTSISLYRHWLQKCEVSHNCGINDLPKSMPSLVLDVSDRNSVKLYEVPALLKERYVALSYCWGTDVQTMMLTQSTKSDLVSGISPQRLDPTIRDSVTVVRELGFRLLWIDALCIFQDDEEWKTRELGIMDKIYRNATFTVVVSAANNVKEGFLHRRSPTLDRVRIMDGHPHPVFKFRAEGSSIEGEENPVILRPADRDENEPWYERAWTLQEMLFSGRRLQFWGNQTTWLCHCMEPSVRKCDGWLTGSGHNHTGYSDHHFEAIMTMLRSTSNSATTDGALSNWYDLVEIYSSRQLRYFRDRLPAISGIAREFAYILGDEYLCGLWKSDLIVGLVWRRRRPKHPGSAGVKSGPSWSWASYEGIATWSTHMRRRWRPNQDLEIIGHVTELMSPNNPFGEVKISELSVRGLLLPIPTPMRDENGDIHIYVEETQASLALEYPEDPRVQPGSGFKLSLLVLVNVDWVGVQGIVVLKEDGEGDRYSRVGWFEVEDVWSVTREARWYGTWDRTPKSQEELQVRVRSVWGGEHNIRQILLV